MITFAKGHRKPIAIQPGQTLMKTLLAHKVPVASSCNGDGVCGKCKLRVIHGAENLSPRSELEIFLSEKYHLQSNERISCQTQVFGPIEIDAGYW